MSFAILPIELVDQISLCLSMKDQVSLAATAKRYTDVVQRVLYRHITLDSQNNQDCLHSLANNPIIAKHVRSFTICVSQSNDLLPVLNEAISNMTELTSLDIWVEQFSNSWIMKTPDTSTYNRLNRFTCSFNLDHNLAHFLNKTPQLRQLHVHSLPTSSSDLVSTLRPDALPLLSQFYGSSQAAQFIVPGRPVEEIHLHSGDLTEEVARSLAYSTGPVRDLSAVTSSHSVSLIGTLTRCMERLVHLRIVTCNFSDAPDLAYVSNIADALRSLPDLQTCEIWGIHWVSSQKGFDDEDRVWHSETFNTDDVLNGNTVLDVSNLYFHHPH
ncbi:hypothetical protein CVT24_004828 [Panaeolus cyanescens]|uniref:F-box domain-containing protein n=1 Tax=Panaeolus cyanescens TaxID=181874 RepID=A0A409W1Z1_9AGAR|nr:hypothetical protein CVT24_004828 [Panaeolus cyanescens]